MEFSYSYRIKASDIWQVRMYYAYSSYLAVVNLMCIVAAIALIVTKWTVAGAVFKAAMLVFLSLFLLLQPLVIYLNARSQAGMQEDEIELFFREEGFTVTVGNKEEEHPWKDVLSMVVRPTLVLIYTAKGQGYILTNRILKDTRKDFIGFLQTHITRKERR